MKFLGAILITICFSLTGVIFADKLKAKYLISKELVLMSQLIDLKMSSNLDETEKIFKSISNAEDLNKLKFLKKIDFQNSSLYDSFKNAVFEQKLPLKKSDIDLLLQLGSIIGTTDYNGQKMILKSYEEQMKKSTESYFDEYKRLSKVYIAFGVFGGCAASILLL